MSARAHLESLLRARKLDVTLTTSGPAALEPAEDRAATGLPALDRLLGGGLRRGHLSELAGPRSSGRTALLCTLLAAAASRGEAVALVDGADRFDPVSAAAATRRDQ
jgi:RecA/RadA recombinase